MKETIGDLIRRIREERELPLRKVAAELDIDQSTLSKYERGERVIKEDLIPKLAQFFGIDEEKLRIEFLGDKILYSIAADKNAETILEVAEEKLKYYKSTHTKQGKFFE